MPPRGHLGNPACISPGFSGQEAIYELRKHSFNAVMQAAARLQRFREQVMMVTLAQQEFT